MIKKILLPSVVSGVVLLVGSFVALFASFEFLPGLMEQYYDPVFRPDDDRAVLFYMHPFVLSLALAWFWERFKGLFEGPLLLRGLELGLVYAVVATIPSMWITFSAIKVSLAMTASWFAYGVFQASIAGIIYAKMNP